ncbi:outer membrane beta-barrel protein, partial [Fulvivirga lutimaris]|uniref:outer membrane beta-barrel protein n=1 Tax=Fulvivirga lutimaris TaxID=1819566 RepID=UPI0012BBDE84
MKKLLAVVLFCLSSLNSFGQTDKGTFQIGISGLPIFYPDNTEETGYSIRSNLGYFPANRFSIGLMPFAGKVEDMKALGATVYFRYYLSNNHISPFFEAGVGFGNLKYDDYPQYNGTMNAFNIGPGIHYNFKNKLSIELLVQYARLKNITYP